LLEREGASVASKGWVLGEAVTYSNGSIS